MSLQREKLPLAGLGKHLSFWLRLSASNTHHTRQPHFTLEASPFRAGHGITALTTLINSWPSQRDTQATALD